MNCSKNPFGGIYCGNRFLHPRMLQDSVVGNFPQVDQHIIIVAKGIGPSPGINKFLVNSASHTGMLFEQFPFAREKRGNREEDCIICPVSRSVRQQL